MSAFFSAACAVALLAGLASAQTQYNMRISITDPTFRSSLFATALGSFAEHRDSCPCNFVSLPPAGGTTARTVSVTFTLAPGASTSCASSLRGVIADQASGTALFVTFRTSLLDDSVGTLVSITAGSAAPPSGGDDNDQNQTWIFVGAGCVAAIVLLIGVAMLVLRGKERRQAMDADAAQGDHLTSLTGPDATNGGAQQQQQQQPQTKQAPAPAAKDAAPAKKVEPEAAQPATTGVNGGAPVARGASAQAVDEAAVPPPAAAPREAAVEADSARGPAGSPGASPDRREEATAHSPSTEEAAEPTTDATAVPVEAAAPAAADEATADVVPVADDHGADGGVGSPSAAVGHHADDGVEHTADELPVDDNDTGDAPGAAEE